MTARKDWTLKGTFYECCRVLDGHCALWFGRDLPEACANLLTYQIKEAVTRLRDGGGQPGIMDILSFTQAMRDRTTSFRIEMGNPN